MLSDYYAIRRRLVIFIVVSSTESNDWLLLLLLLLIIARDVVFVTYYDLQVISERAGFQHSAETTDFDFKFSRPLLYALFLLFSSIILFY